MVYRWTAWIVALGAICALQYHLDDTPADPARAHTSLALVQVGPAQDGLTQQEPVTPARVMLVYSVATFSPSDRSFCPASPVSQLPTHLRTFVGPPSIAAGLTQAFEAFALAQARNLQAPVTVHTQFNENRPGWFGAQTVSDTFCIFPAWDTQAAYPSRDAWFSDGVGQAFWEQCEGYALVRNAFAVEETKQDFWASYRRGLAGPESEPTLEPDMWATRFYPTGPLHPLGDTDAEFDVLLAGRLNRALGDHTGVMQVAGGLAIHADTQHHANVAQLLMNPRFIHLARTLRGGSPERRALARREAFSDDDPWVVAFAVAELCTNPESRWELPFLDLPQLFEAAGRCDPQALASWHLLVERMVRGLPEEEWRRIPALVRGRHFLPVPDDPSGLAPSLLAIEPGSALCSLALTHPQAKVRRAAEAAILSSFPREAFNELIARPQRLVCGWETPRKPVTLRPEVARWTTAEREAFFQRLLARVRASLDQPDSDRAVETVRDAFTMCAYFDLLPQSSAARGHLYELAADLPLDPRHQPAFAQPGHQTITGVAAAELLRRSDPEARRVGCLLTLKATSMFGSLPNVEGDPYTEDILEEYQRGPFGGFGSGSSEQTPEPAPGGNGGGFFF
jgi:hypothetical protein